MKPKINVWQIVALVIQAVSELQAIQAGEDVDLEPIHVTSGTTFVTININVHQKAKAA